MPVLDAYSVARKKLLSSIFSKDKTELFGEQAQHPQVPSKVTILVPNQHKIIWLEIYFSAEEPESTSTVQEPPVPRGAVS